MMILLPITALPSNRHVKVPDANLGPLPTGVPTAVLQLICSAARFFDAL